MKQMSKFGLPGLVVLLVAAPALGANYLELVPFSTLDGGWGSTVVHGGVVEGQTAYFNPNLGAGGHITKVTSLNGVQTYTELLSTAQWAAATTKTSLLSFYGFEISGNNLQFADSSTDAIWRVDKNAPHVGALLPYVSNAQILAHTQIAQPGLTSASLLSPHTITNTGEHVFYEGSSDSILVTTGPGTMTTLISDLQLIAATGNDRVSGGLGMDAAGTLYWGSSTSDDMWKRDSGGTISQVLSTANITAVTGATAAGFGDIFPAPDGLVYFFETSADHIMRFDPANPAGTLAIFRSEADLLAGPAGSDSVGSMSWYNDLTWHGVTSSSAGYFQAPEPTSLGLLALGGMVVLRRRRR